MRHHLQRLVLLSCLLIVWTAVAAQEIALPNRPGSLKFAVIGDSGTGEPPQYEVGAQMARFHAAFPFDMVIMLGDNLYGSENPDDFVKKFERPYSALLERGVQFYAAIGNHDDSTQRFYELWNMGGQRYYTFAKHNVRFFVLDTDDLDSEQVRWLDKELARATEDWKIPYFHHPLYSSGGRHGSNLELRVVLEPLFIEHGVRVVFSGHDHIYERTNSQNGIYYFVSGAAGQLRRGDLRRSSSITAAGYDQDQSFMIVEVDGDEMWFQAVTRTGEVVDSGSIRRRAPSTTAPDGRENTPATSRSP